MRTAYIGYGIVVNSSVKLPLDDELVEYFYCGGGIHIFVVKDSIIQASDGLPTSFDPFNLCPTCDRDPIPMNKTLADFFVKNNIDIPDAPSWYLF